VSKGKPKTPAKRGDDRVSDLTVRLAASGRPAHAGSLRAYQDDIQDLVELLRRNNLSELEVEHNGLRVKVRRDASAIPVVSTTAEPVAVVQDVTRETLAASMPQAAGMVTITSPIVGTFYRSASPDADPYVEEGDVVKKGQVLCIVEAMKLMNEIESEVNGKIVKVLAESTKPVEYGQPLFLIDPSPSE